MFPKIILSFSLFLPYWPVQTASTPASPETSCTCAKPPTQRTVNSRRSSVSTEGSCEKWKNQQDCEANHKAISQLVAGEAFLAVDEYLKAKAACEAALLLPATTERARTCITKAKKALQDGANAANNRSVAQIELGLKQLDFYLEEGEVDKAFSMAGDLRKQFATGSQEGSTAESYLVKQLDQRFRRSYLSPWLGPLQRLVTALIPAVLTWLVKIAIILLSIWGAWGLFKALTTWHRNRMRRGAFRRELTGITRWRVWNVAENEPRGATGPVMEALRLETNSLLSDHLPERHPHRHDPPSLLVSPIPTSAGPPNVWSNLLAARPHSKNSNNIENLPMDEMQRHSFLLEEAFDEIDAKLPGVELKGLVGIYKNLRRWHYQDDPALHAFAASDEKTASVRLTTYRKTWPRDPEENSERLLGRLRSFVNRNLPPKPREETISVLASSPRSDHVDAIGLAAHRAAFKLFYRLAKDDAHPNEITAIAAFYQGRALLLLVL
jgi:hypothetical protein